MSWHGRKCEENVAPHFCYSSCCLDLLNLNTFHRNESTGDCFKCVYIYLERCRYLLGLHVQLCPVCESADPVAGTRWACSLGGARCCSSLMKVTPQCQQIFFTLRTNIFTQWLLHFGAWTRTGVFYVITKKLLSTLLKYTVHFCAVLYGSDAVFLNCKCIVYVADFTIFHPTSVTIAVFDRKSCMTFGHL